MTSLHLPLARVAGRAFPALLLLAVGCASEATQPVAFVANSGSNQIQVINLDSGRTVRTLHAGAGPWRLLSSPDGASLWAQHWTARTTAVIDLKSLEIRANHPFRGPGVFSAGGDRFWTSDWPDYGLAELDGDNGRVVARHQTEIGKVADLVNAPSGKFYLSQQDLLSPTDGPRYSYVLSFDPNAGPQTAPQSLPTGLSPEHLLAVPGQPFLLTADRGTDGISIVNSAGDRRSLRVCAAPRRLALSDDRRLLAVGCWQADTGPAGEVVLFSVDFSARPWPVMEERSRTPLAGVAALQFSPGGRSLYGLDEVFDRLVEWDSRDLTRRREIALGSQPRDLAIMAVPLGVVAGWERKSRPDSALMEALERNRSWGGPFESLGWTEVISWREPVKAEGGPPPGPQAWKVAQFLNGKGATRSKSPSGWRIADAGWSYSIRDDGRFWRAPRLELLGRVLALPNLSDDEAIRLMAGDFPDAPFESGGIATDVFCRHETPDGAVFIWGASGPEEPVSQLWIEASTGAPLRLIERVPSSSGSGHADGGASGIIDTRFVEWRTLPGGVKLPARLERVIDGRVQDVVFEDALLEGRPEGFFDLVRLGGVRPSPDYLPPAVPSAQVKPTSISVGEYLATPWAAHPAYSTNPPTSGPRVRELAPWGVDPYPVPPALQVHNLEHGGVIIQYNCKIPCGDLRERLQTLAQRGQPLIVAPSPYLASRLALTAWGSLLTLDDWDEERIQGFIQSHAGVDHHSP